MTGLQSSQSVESGRSGAGGKNGVKKGTWRGG